MILAFGMLMKDVRFNNQDIMITSFIVVIILLVLYVIYFY